LPEQAELLITEPGLAELVLRAEQNAEDLSELDRLKFYEFTTWRISAWELTHQASLDGLLDEETWVGWNGYFLLIVEDKPGYVRFFKDTRTQWDSRFMMHVDEILGFSR
jgi:hypothetical protein